MRFPKRRTWRLPSFFVSEEVMIFFSSAQLSEETTSSSQMSLFLRQAQCRTSRKVIPPGRKAFRMDSCPRKGLGLQKALGDVKPRLRKCLPTACCSMTAALALC